VVNPKSGNHPFPMRDSISPSENFQIRRLGFLFVPLNFHEIGGDLPKIDA